MSDFETIRERLLEREVYGYHERSSFNRSLAIAYASALQDAGSWADINYHDRGKSTWLPAMHLGRTNVMLRGARHRDVADVDRLTRWTPLARPKGSGSVDDRKATTGGITQSVVPRL